MYNTLESDSSYQRMENCENFKSTIDTGDHVTRKVTRTSECVHDNQAFQQNVSGFFLYSHFMYEKKVFYVKINGCQSFVVSIVDESHRVELPDM
jgi:hypothetical protein